MRAVPLYPEQPETPMCSGPGLQLDRSCHRCELGSVARSVCLPADGVGGGLYLVGAHPGRVEDRAGRVHRGRSGTDLRRVVGGVWGGAVVYDNVVRCFPGEDRGVNDRHIAACRPFLRKALLDAAPDRIVALGADAAAGMLGRGFSVMDVRRGYGWVDLAGRLTPVFVVPHPAAGARNYVYMRYFREDLAAVASADPEPPPWDAELSVVETVRDAELAVDTVRGECEWFAYDMEWAGLPNTGYFEVLTVAVCPAGSDDAFVWPRSATGDSAMMRPLLDLLADPSVGKVGHNIKADNSMAFAAWGVEVLGTCGDTRLWRRMLDAVSDGRLEVCAELVGMGGHKGENDVALSAAVDEVVGIRGSQGRLFYCDDPALRAAKEMPGEPPERFAYALIPEAVRDRYCARDAVATARLGERLGGEMEASPSIRGIWDKVVCRATFAVGWIERWGIAADAGAVRMLDEVVAMEAEVVRGRLRRYGTFDPSSPDQVADLLFNKLGLKPGELTKSGRPSTKFDVLRQLRDEHPAVADLILCRKLEKFRSNHGLKVLGFIRRDGRIYPELKIDGAETGRLSCVAPPLHQLPRADSEKGAMIRRCYVAPPGKVLLCFDYSQIELRIAAMLSGDPVMTGMFVTGEDFHWATARLISKIYWGIEPEAVEKRHRSTAKNFNFGVLYGMTDKGLAKRLGCSVADARRLRQAILGKWLRLGAWIDESIAYVRRHGYCWTWWQGERARRRPLPGIGSRDSLKKSNAENSAVNTPVQGTAADFMLASICDIVEWLHADAVPAKLVMTVHDSVILEVSPEDRREVVGGVLDIMLGQDAGDVPLKVDVEEGTNFADLSPLDPTSL